MKVPNPSLAKLSPAHLRLAVSALDALALPVAVGDDQGLILLANTAWLAHADTTTATRVQLGDHVLFTVDDAHARLVAQLEEQRAAVLSATEEAARVQRDLAEVAAVSSHELRSGLRGISLLAQWITEDIGANRSPETKEHLDLLASRVSRMEAMLEALLRYLRIGQQREDPVEVDTAALVGSITRKLTRAPGMNVRTVGEMPKLRTPRAQLRQVLVELVENAIAHHDRPDGDISISGRDLGEVIELNVRDDGPGLTERTQERVFHLFQTGDTLAHGFSHFSGKHQAAQGHQNANQDDRDFLIERLGGNQQGGQFRSFASPRESTGHGPAGPAQRGTGRP